MLYPMFDVHAGLMPILLEESDEGSVSSTFSTPNKIGEYANLPPEHRTDSFIICKKSIEDL